MDRVRLLNNNASICWAILIVVATFCPNLQGQNVLLLHQDNKKNTAFTQDLVHRLDYLSQGKIAQINSHPDGDARDMQVFLYQTGQFTQDTITLRDVGTDYVSLKLLNKWDKDSLIAEYASRGMELDACDFSQVLSALTGGELRQGSPQRRGHPAEAEFDGLIPYTYRDKPCLLLWDDSEKLQKIYSETDFRYNEWGWGKVVYDFAYTLRDIQQLSLCRYGKKNHCYVLLLLTRPMVEMD